MVFRAANTLGVYILPLIKCRLKGLLKVLPGNDITFFFFLGKKEDTFLITGLEVCKKKNGILEKFKRVTPNPVGLLQLKLQSTVEPSAAHLKG